MNDNNKMLERVLLMMKYDTSKTLTENSDVVRNEFLQLLNEGGRVNPKVGAPFLKQLRFPGRVQPSGLTNLQIQNKVVTYANNPFRNGNYPSVKMQVDYATQLKASSKAKPPQPPVPVKNTVTNTTTTTKDASILSTIGTKIQKNPWKFAIGLGLTGAGIWYFLRDKTYVAPCLLNSLSEEEINGLVDVGTNGEITRSQVGNRFADLNGGLIFSLDRSVVYTGNRKYQGTYSCEGDAIKISIAGSEFTIGSTGIVDKGTSGGGSGGGGSRYKQCPETFPIAMYCKNSTIARVQGCVGAKQDGAFGPKTSAALVAKGADGSSITQATIDKVCGAATAAKIEKLTSDVDVTDIGDNETTNNVNVKSSDNTSSEDGIGG